MKKNIIFDEYLCAKYFIDWLWENIFLWQLYHCVDWDSDVTVLSLSSLQITKWRRDVAEETRNCFKRRKMGICSILLMERCYVRSHSLKWCYRFFVNLSFCPKTLSTLFQRKRAKMKQVFTSLLRSSELIIQLCCIYIVILHCVPKK